MNVTPVFINGVPFKKFERKIGNECIGYLVKIGLSCQQRKSPYIEINDGEDLEIMLNADGGDFILKSLIDSKLIEETENEFTYYCAFFVEQNKQLLSNWANGELKKGKARKEGQAKPDRSFVSKATVRNAVFGRDNHTCVYCGTKRDLTIDHIIPLSKGGENELGNLQTLCSRCNTVKNDSIEPKFNSNQTNSNQTNSNQTNSNQFNRYASQPTSNASQSVSNASSNPYPDLEPF